MVDKREARFYVLYWTHICHESILQNFVFNYFLSDSQCYEWALLKNEKTNMLSTMTMCITEK